MNHLESRNQIAKRIQKELIGPGSDLFSCSEDCTNEVIEGKPLQRYFSGILFPKQLSIEAVETETLGEFNEENNAEPELENSPEGNLFEQQNLREPELLEPEDEKDEADTIPKYNSNAFFPSFFGFSFCVKASCKKVDLRVSFGNYKKAKYNDILLPYSGGELELLEQFGFSGLVYFDTETQCLRFTKEIKRKEKGVLTNDYLQMQSAFTALRENHWNSKLYKHLQKLFYKDKYKRNHNDISFIVSVPELFESENNHQEFVLSQLPCVTTENWHPDLIENLFLHVKGYQNNSGKYYIKAVIENRYFHKKSQFSLSKEKLNQLSLFQTEIMVNSDELLSFRDYHANLYKSDEDRMLDYLFRKKLSYGIGHNASCTWEFCEQDKIVPTWVKTTFIPSYGVKSQSTNVETIDREILNIKGFSIYNDDVSEIINNLHKVTKAYESWIKIESQQADNELGKENIEKCTLILGRMREGIKLLTNNTDALKAFQLANTAIFIQMFQTEWHFNKKDGFEAFNTPGVAQLEFMQYGHAAYPNNKREPEWRPFQLAFILQSISSFVQPESADLDLVDLLYFPTGGGKTEAYLAVSAFLIFWRRLKYSNTYDGVNVIMRYTLRLLSAQQFERATKLILACEFIRQYYSDLGDKAISIGFWIGDKTIPNSIETAKRKLDFAFQKLNKGKQVINPFQLANCQWCNTKIISKVKEADNQGIIGHRIDRKLSSFCLNPKCRFNEANGGMPIVLVDEDIYKAPPTVLFATVDKFANLAWSGESTTLFNFGSNRKPDLIIQDELHLLNGPLGSLVGLFENAVISLCTDDHQRPKIIASTATVKNVSAQIMGLYGRKASIFPQYATNADDTFFSKTTQDSKRQYYGILPTGKTTVVTNLQLLSALLFGRLEIWEKSADKRDADQYWTLLSYFKSLKDLGRFSNKISSELMPIIQQLQVRYLKNQGDQPYNYWKLPYRNLELTSRIPNERIKKNLDKLDIAFDGSLKDHKSYDIILATNMISVGLDVGRLGVMVMNGMPNNTAEYIQASSRVARQNEGIVVALLDPFNSRDLSYFEDFIQFHKTFYRQVEPLSVTPFAENALDKMLFTLMVTYFRHKYGFTDNNTPSALLTGNYKERLRSDLKTVFEKHRFAQNELENIYNKIDRLIEDWDFKVQGSSNLFYNLKMEDGNKKRLLIPLEERKSVDELRVGMKSMRSIEPNVDVLIKQQ